MSWKDKLGEATVLYEKAKALAAKGERTPEESKSIPGFIEEAKALREEAQSLQTLETEGLKLLALEELKTQALVAKTDTQIPQGKEEFKSWNEFLQAVHLRKDPRLSWIADERKGGHEQKSLSGEAGATGGFLIPAQFLPVLQAVQAESSLMRAAGASVIRMTNRQLSLPVLDQSGTTAGEAHWFGGVKFYWEGEGKEKTESEPKFKKVTLTAKKLIGLTHASDELLADSAISLGDFLQSPMGFAGGVAFMEDYNFLRGPGGNRPRGIVDAPATIALARATAGTVQYQDVIEMLSHALPTAKLTWMISQSLMSDIIQLSGPSGNASYVWQPNAREGIPGYLLGYPVRWTEKLPYKGSRGDIALVAAQYYLVGDRQQTLIESTKFARWVYDETSWRVVHRVDGQPWLSQPITYIDGTTTVSPFVVLESAGS